MKITWLGQASLLIETKASTIMVDPYLTDSIYDRLGQDYSRLVPLRREYLDVRPDLILLSHDHTDHLDVPSLKCLLDSQDEVTVLAGANAWTKARTEVGGPHNYVRLVPGVEWTHRDVHIRVVSAVHSDVTAVGFVLTVEGKTLYITGDTLYSQTLVEEIPKPIDLMIAVVNGRGNNMNGVEAARLAQILKAGLTIPVHWGLFAKYADTPEIFLEHARQRNVKTYHAAIYEKLDTELLMKGEIG